MENNLDDFFKDKLNDLNSSDDGWDEPSESVWANAQPNFPTYGKSKRNWLAVLAILLGLSLLGTGTYLYKVKQANNALKQEMAALNSKIDTKSNQTKSSNNELIRQNTTLQNQLDELQLTLENEQKKGQRTVKNAQDACIVALDKAIENTTNKYEDIIQKQQTLIKQLEQENQSLKSKNVQLQQQQPIATKTDESVDKNADNQIVESNYLLHKKAFLVENNIVKSVASPTLEQPEKAWKKLEFGLDLASIGFNVELTNSVENAADMQSVPMSNFDNLRTADQPNYLVTNSPAFGFHFGYGLKEDFYIRTGMRYANFNINDTYSSGILYDQSSEYLDNQGSVLNDLVLNSATPFNTIQQGVTVEIPTGTFVNSNDILQTTLSNTQNYHFVQVPLGFAYYRGKRRLQMEFQGGLTWNLIRFNDYSFDADFQLNNVNLPVNRSSIISNTVNTSSYLGGYLGIGANYRLSDTWHIRGGLTLEEIGLRSNTQSFPRRYLLESGFNLSLNYRF